MTGDQRKLASLWYGEGREREREREEKGRDKDRETGGGEKEDGKRQRSQIERGVVHILWSFSS